MNMNLPADENIYGTECPILYAMKIIGQKWKLPILWYISDSENRTTLFMTALGVASFIDPR